MGGQSRLQLGHGADAAVAIRNLIDSPERGRCWSQFGHKRVLLRGRFGGRVCGRHQQLKLTIRYSEAPIVRGSTRASAQSVHSRPCHEVGGDRQRLVDQRIGVGQRCAG